VSAGGATSIVKVRFEPRAAVSLSPPTDPEALEKAQPGDEIRRVFPDKRLVHDLRTGHRGEMDEEGLDLAPVLDAYLRWRVFSPEADDAEA
jgi:hypothetical protein